MRSGRLGLAVGIAVSLLLAAGLLWLVGFVGASAVECPAGSNAHGLTGLETPRSIWPPGAECAAPGQAQPTVAELIPGLAWAIVSLAFAGLAILATGLALEIRGLRSGSVPRGRPEAGQPTIHSLAWPE